MADFEPGKKVVCVWDDWDVRGAIVTALPVRGEKYVIRDTRIVHFKGQDILTIALHELVNHPIHTVDFGVCEPYFAVRCLSGEPNFRPVIERKTDISELEKLLLRNDARTPELV